MDGGAGGWEVKNNDNSNDKKSDSVSVGVTSGGF
jgi:hypothetical protein